MQETLQKEKEEMGEEFNIIETMMKQYQEEAMREAMYVFLENPFKIFIN